ncbi:DUF1285 domain-containing protein [Kaistia dalseonensis]|uniref:DUF1285 domain-containing protein n=1 Tax=Kaistia dalseonensis TaxID=410840 RepID=A0ABU0H656_9HYPH|nr:DUF1285 domain-containing protein [Kaistia dalseonensis]MCX5495211.1 DUF1285 domain-containing protein [Kaistia dalseonensis]MDQ0437796.1 hypothetical protein [Kaistia dalseonensis]
MSGSKQGETKAGDVSPLGTRAEQLIAEAAAMPGPAPVHLWNPPDCGRIDIRIDRAGTWFHEGEPIRREALVRLFARVLRRQADGGFVLVTPVEKFAISVEDVPFLAVELIVDDEGGVPRLLFVTNLGEVVPLDADHPLRIAVPDASDGLVPYLTVRPGLEARLTRSVVHDLVEAASVRGDTLGVWSAGQFFVIGAAGETVGA